MCVCVCVCACVRACICDDIVFDDHQEQLRPVCAVALSTPILTEVLLLSEGFLYSVILAKKISYLWNMLKSQVSI